MKTPRRPVSLDDLMAFADGWLDPARRRAVEAAMESDQHCAQQVAAMRAQRQALRARFDPVLAEPIPARLLGAGQLTHSSWLRVAAVVAWMAIGGGAGSALTWQYLSHPPGGAAVVAIDRAGGGLTGFVHQAAAAYATYAPDVRRPVEIYSAQEQQLVGWLSKRLGRELKAPSLEGSGFKLVGGRLLPGEINKPAAQFMYETAQGQRITLYLRSLAQATPETAFRYAVQDGVGTFYWVDRDWGYALSGDLPRDALLNIAMLAYEQLAAPPAGRGGK